MLQLHNAHGGLEISHAVIEPDFVVDIAALFVCSETEIAFCSQAFAQSGIIRDDHTAFACRQDLVRIKTEYCDIAERPDRATESLSPQRFSRIFDDAKIVAPRDVDDAIDPSRVSIGVHNENRPCLLCYRALYGVRVDIPRVIRVDRNGNRTTSQDRKHRRNHGKIRDDDLVMLLEVENVKRQMNRCCTAAYRYRVSYADFLSEPLLELVQKWTPRRYPSAVDCLA